MKVYNIIIAIACISTTCSQTLSDTSKSNETNTKISRQKRWLPRFPYNSCYALAVVIAIPLELKGRNVYLSYNFETNFYFPYFDNVQGIVPLPFATIDQEDTNQGTLIANLNPEERNLNGHAEQIDSTKQNTTVEITSSSIAMDENETTTVDPTTTQTPNSENMDESNSEPLKRASREILEHFMTRARFYKILENKMNSSGMHGRKCLQKAICDVAANPITEHNGIIGDIVHIIFTPSSSKDEKLPRDLNEAEQRGRDNNCQVYHDRCPTSILDVISMFA